MSISNPKSGFVNVNGIRLHYLDWGGNGQVLTRRGQGDSDIPETGYDTNTLTEDIRLFMDHLNIEKTVLAGHSLAGMELTHFAATYPNRVEKLVYLDALDDRREESVIIEQSPFRNIKIKKEERSPHTIAEYIANMKRDFPRFAEIWSELWDEEVAHIRISRQVPTRKDRRDSRWTSLLFHRPGGPGL